MRKLGMDQLNGVDQLHVLTANGPDLIRRIVEYMNHRFDVRNAGI